MQHVSQLCLSSSEQPDIQALAVPRLLGNSWTYDKVPDNEVVLQRPERLKVEESSRGPGRESSLEHEEGGDADNAA